MSNKTKSKKIYSALLEFYPKIYLDEFGSEMEILFKDLLAEKELNNQSSFIFWVKVITDLLVTLPQSYIYYFHHMKTQFFNSEKGKITLASLIILAPAILLAATATVLQFFFKEGFQAMQNSTLYNPTVFMIVFIGLPIFATLIGLYGIIFVHGKNDAVLSVSFFKSNLILFVIVLMAIGLISVVYLHDSVHCFTNLQILTSNLGECVSNS